MKDVRFVFLHCGAFDTTVFDSQVVDSIVALREFGILFDLCVLLSAGELARDRALLRRRKMEISERIAGRVSVYPTPWKRRRLGDAISVAALLAELVSHRAPRTVVHARGDLAAAYSVVARRGWSRLRTVYDIRGDAAAEFAHFARMDRAAAATVDRDLAHIDWECRTAFDGASHVFAVSEVLRDRMASRYGVSHDRFTVIPCVADERKFHTDEVERKRTRAEEGFGDRFVVLYPGRFGRWHWGPEMIRIVKAMMDADPAVFFLVLTPDITEATSLASAGLPEGRFAVRTAAHSEVPRLMRAADLGLLLREPDPLNEVACPTKFAEYMMCGLPVLISRGIGDCTAFVEKHGSGVVLDGEDAARAVEALRFLRAEDPVARRERLASAARVFSRQRAAARMAGIYHAVADS